MRPPERSAEGALTSHHQQRSAPMTKSGILAAAAILVSALASPQWRRKSSPNPATARNSIQMPIARTRDQEIPIPAATSVKPIRVRPIGIAPGRTAITVTTRPRLLARRCRGRCRRRRGRHGGCHRHGSDRRRRICPPQRFRLHPRHLVPRRGRPAASLPVGPRANHVRKRRLERPPFSMRER